MQNMTYALKERIGDPLIFSGRKKEMTLLLDWASGIPREISKSRALLGRRKSGKTAIMQRLFNILWNQNGKVIPIYIDVSDDDQWLHDFVFKYYQTFLSQYISFLTRTVLPEDQSYWAIDELEQKTRDLDDKTVLKELNYVQKYYLDERTAFIKDLAFGAPARFASKDHFFLVMIDEIQFMTKHIFYDQERKVQARRLPGAYHGLVESKTAPMLVSGSYIGWMSRMMFDMFKGGRLSRTPISPRLAFTEGMECVQKYSEYHDIPVSDDSALTINILTQSDPYYIASVFRSPLAGKDLTATDTVIETLEYEISQEGDLYGTWSEYIDSTIKEVNDAHAKQILLFLSRERYKECTRVEIGNHLNGELSDRELEHRLRTLVYGDLITKGSNDFRYSGIPDDILDLIFRDRYEEEIFNTRPDITAELASRIKALEDHNKSLQGALNELKGRMLEFVIYRELNRISQKGATLHNLKQRLRPFLTSHITEFASDMADALKQSKFDTVWRNYYIRLPDTGVRELDIVAEGADNDSYWALIAEIKNRDEQYPPTMNEVKVFITKTDLFKQQIMQEDKKIRFICPVYISANGFDALVEKMLHKNGVLTADMDSWDVQ